MTGPKGNSEFCFPETFNVPRGEAEVFCYTSQLKSSKKLRKNDLLDAYGGCAYSTSGSQTELSFRNDTITVSFFAANKNKDNT